MSHARYTLNIVERWLARDRQVIPKLSIAAQLCYGSRQVDSAPHVSECNFIKGLLQPLASQDNRICWKTQRLNFCETGLFLIRNPRSRPIIPDSISQTHRSFLRPSPKQELIDFLMHNKKMKTRNPDVVPSLNILLTNGRFPVSIDLARQLKLAGHTVFVVDPMRVHVCKFSTAVKKSFRVSAPYDNPAEYIAGVKNVVRDKKIDLIIPMHEEIFHLAECDDPEIIDRLFAPPFGALVRLHNKWEFNRLLKRLDLDYPQASLCRSMDDVKTLDRTKEWALKPVFGRCCDKVFHLKPDEPLPSMAISEDLCYTAQEWLYGSRYCSYSILRDGQIRALSIYPVKDTLDGSSCVYFESTKHPDIRKYVEKIAAAHPGVTAQLAFDFIETNSGRLVAIECNPRATSGIHLFAGTSDLANCITEPAKMASVAKDVVVPRDGAHRQSLPGMLIVPKRSNAYFKRLVTTRDVTFSVKDLLPLPTLLMQPLFLTCYLNVCEGKGGTSVPDLFQEDLLWEPVGEHLERVRKMLKEMDEGELQNGIDGTMVAMDGSEPVEKRNSSDDVSGEGKDKADGTISEAAVES